MGVYENLSRQGIVLPEVIAPIGMFKNVSQVGKLLGFVASEPDFDRQHLVINGASQVFADAFGEAGRHSRSAIGVAALPGGISVEVEGIFEIE